MNSNCTKIEENAPTPTGIEKSLRELAEKEKLAEEEKLVQKPMYCKKDSEKRNSEIKYIYCFDTNKNQFIKMALLTKTIQICINNTNNNINKNSAINGELRTKGGGTLRPYRPRPEEEKTSTGTQE
jgi:hypothetical protein